MGRVEGKIALVTGAAAGIGRAAAEALAAEGATVYASDVDDAGTAETVALITKAGGKAYGLAQDVTSEPRWAEVVAAIKDQSKALHILVNNAGIAIAADIFTMELADWRRQTAINIDGVFLGVKHGAPLIAASGGGSIINISSVAGLRGAAGLAGYCATQGAVKLFTQSAALECAQGKMNVRVNSVHPGIIDTAIWQKMPQNGMGAIRTALAPEGANTLDPVAIGAATPIGYNGVPADIANGIVFLASEESRYMTGAELVIDGGMTAK